ncbi:MAG TPA: response regulator [Candidatus Nitrosocosmicus sp.]|jgi:DNA-binding response OmpR family regulator|nr:response regulator [Candidatus Nitrosocosmicus sp.]
MDSSPPIIIVEDEMELASLYKTYLNAAGFNAISFVDPLLAFEYYTKNTRNIQLVITDLRMPTMSGIELACKIRKINKNVVIFLITAFMIEDLINSSKEYMEAQIDRILEKPMKLGLLKQHISEHLSMSNASQNS